MVCLRYSIGDEWSGNGGMVASKLEILITHTATRSHGDVLTSQEGYERLSCSDQFPWNETYAEDSAKDLAPPNRQQFW
jgi:hypothetical protein